MLVLISLLGAPGSTRRSLVPSRGRPEGWKGRDIDRACRASPQRSGCRERGPKARSHRRPRGQKVERAFPNSVLKGREHETARIAPCFGRTRVRCYNRHEEHGAQKSHLHRAASRASPGANAPTQRRRQSHWHRPSRGRASAAGARAHGERPGVLLFRRGLWKGARSRMRCGCFPCGPQPLWGGALAVGDLGGSQPLPRHLLPGCELDRAWSDDGAGADGPRAPSSRRKLENGAGLASGETGPAWSPAPSTKLHSRPNASYRARAHIASDPSPTSSLTPLRPPPARSGKRPPGSPDWALCQSAIPPAT